MPSFAPRCGIFLGSQPHLTNLGAGGGAEGCLTCLSVRCLSSYLFFRQFQRTSKPRADSPIEERRRQAPRYSCAISNLSADLGEKTNWARNDLS